MLARTDRDPLPFKSGSEAVFKLPSSPAPARARPFVSVIIPAWNAAPFIGETLASAQAQTWPNLEIIVVDDGSTDDTAALVEAAAATDFRITLIRQANAGVAAARNRAITAAKGEYVAPLDADDLWHPENVEAQVEALERAGPGTALAYTSYVVVDERGVVQRYSGHRRIESRTAVRRALLDGYFIGNGSACVIRRECALSIGGYDASLRARAAQGCEDWALSMTLAERWDFAAVPRFLVGYRQHADSMSMDAAQMSRSSRLLFDAVRARGSTDLELALLAAAGTALYAGLFFRAIRLRDPAAVREVLRSVRRGGWRCVARFTGRCLRAALTVLQRPIRRVANVRGAGNDAEPQIVLPADWSLIEPLRSAPQHRAEAAVGRSARIATRSIEAREPA